MGDEHTIAVERLITTVRGQRVILSTDLAAIYAVKTKALNQAIRRNEDRFPADFMFRLSPVDVAALSRSRSQFVTLKRGFNIKYLPLAFTEHGAVMAATVLNSQRLAKLEQRVGAHDHELQTIIRAIRELIRPTESPRRKIGFKPPM
ncbi:MAG TPA: ORF6N domain-containing protein [Methylomirabilota bacterium]|jgi:hypothetical protein|nr:ORF6N domain-containing protein [Methylomirabilota bacterium]